MAAESGREYGYGAAALAMVLLRKMGAVDEGSAVRVRVQEIRDAVKGIDDFRMKEVDGVAGREVLVWLGMSVDGGEVVN